MLGWETIAPTLRNVITACAKDIVLPSTRFDAEWREGAIGAINDEQQLAVLMRVTSIIGIGEDEIIWEDEDDALTAMVVGQRKFTVQITAITTERTDSVWAMVALDRIRTRLVRPGNIQALLDIDVSVIDIRQSIKTTFKDGGRVMNAAIMDVVFGGVVNDVDTAPPGWIEVVVITSHVHDTSGIELPYPPNVVDMVVPEGALEPPPTIGTTAYVNAEGALLIGQDSHAIYTGPPTP